MSDAKAQDNGAVTKKPRQGRSPAFPFIPLAKALERTDVFRLAEGGRPKHFAPIVSACKAWGIGAKSGPATQTVAALGHFGLLEFDGSGETRSARPTETALRILLDKQPISPERDALIQRVALSPSIHKELWDKWGVDLPSDPTFETYLVRDRGFSDSGARDLMAEYKSTIAFAKLSEAATIPERTDDEKPQFGGAKIGDLVQWTSQGANQFREPRAVIAISDDGNWLWVAGEDKAAIPMNEVQVTGKAQQPASQIPPPPPPHVVAAMVETSKPGLRKEVFALDEGDVVLTYPDSLSAASFHDLEGYLQLFLRKAQRRAGAGDYFADVYAPDGITAKETKYFTSFQSLLTFMNGFYASQSDDLLRVHLPAKASNEERKLATEAGGRLVL